MYSVFHRIGPTCWQLVQNGRNAENVFGLIKMLFQMAPRSSVKIVTWLGKLKDLDKVYCHFAKEKGMEKFPRKVPIEKVFKCVIDRFMKTGSDSIGQLFGVSG